MNPPWLLLLFSSISTSCAIITTAKAPNSISKPSCPQKCGNLTIPYTFGIGPECSTSTNSAPYFSILCNTSYNPPKAFPMIPFGYWEESEIIDINESQIVVQSAQIASRCYDSKGNVTSDKPAAFDMYGSAFTYSAANKLMVIGCDDYALVTASSGTTSKGNKQHYSVGCLALCSDQSKVIKRSCSGVGCCRTSIPSGLQSFGISLSSLRNHTGPPPVVSFHPYGYAFLTGGDRFSFGGASDFVGETVIGRERYGVPLVLDWVAGNFNSTSGNSTIEKELFRENG